MNLEQQMARALKGKFFTIGDDGRTIDVKAPKALKITLVPKALARRDVRAPVLGSEEQSKIEPILNVVERHYGTPVSLICGPMKLRHHVRARRAATYLAWSFARLTNAQIALSLGYSHRTAIPRAANTVVDHWDEYEPELSLCVAELQRKSKPKQEGAAS